MFVRITQKFVKKKKKRPKKMSELLSKFVQLIRPVLQIRILMPVV